MPKAQITDWGNLRKESLDMIAVYCLARVLSLALSTFRRFAASSFTPCATSWASKVPSRYASAFTLLKQSVLLRHLLCHAFRKFHLRSSLWGPQSLLRRSPVDSILPFANPALLGPSGLRRPTRPESIRILRALVRARPEGSSLPYNSLALSKIWSSCCGSLPITTARRLSVSFRELANSAGDLFSCENTCSQPELEAVQAKKTDNT